MQITGADLAILDFIYDGLYCGSLDAVMPVTALGNAEFVHSIAVDVFFKRTRKTGLMIGCALILGLLVCNSTLKPPLREKGRSRTARWNCSSPGRRISFVPGHRSLRLSLRRFSSSVSARRE